jgi:hypothetical protein
MVTHPHKVFVDTKENKLYWPMDKNFWVRLAASPDDDAPSYLLERVAPESDISTEQYQNKGIELEIVGKQFIRWYNYVTKQTVNLQFFSDGTPPVTKATCTGAPIAEVAGTTYYGKGLKCSLASEDDLSGVETTFLSIDGAQYQPYKGDVTLDREKPVVLRYYAIDRVGYAETPLTMRFTVDLSAPTTNHAIVGNAIGDVLSTQAKFRITSSDTLSGVATTWARIDNKEYAQVTNGEVSVEDLPDGDHTLNYYSIDKVSNREQEHSFPFYLDRIPPVATSAVVGDLYMAPTGTRYISGRSKVKLTATDNKIGVKQIDYSYDGAKYDVYSDLIQPPTRQGVGKVDYRASDRLSNTSVVSTLPYSMDLVAPQSAYKTIGPMYQERTDVYITKETRIDLSATDDASGVQKIEYQVEGTADPIRYTGPLTFADEGRKLLRYWATDQVNNREMDKAVVLITDNTPPQIFPNLSVKPTSTSADGISVYRKGTSLFLGATDNSSGVHKIYYSINGAKETEYKSPVLMDHEGSFVIDIRADDNLGNQSTKQLKFIIKG